MDAAPIESGSPGGVLRASAAHEPADAADSTSRLNAVDGMVVQKWQPECDFGADAAAFVWWAESVIRPLDGDTTPEEIRALLDALADQEAKQAPLLMRLMGHGFARPAPLRDGDLSWGNLLVQCKSCRDQQAAGAHDLHEIEPPDSSAAEAAEPGAQWRTLPPYTYRPFVARSCCTTNAFTPETAATARLLRMHVPLTEGKAQTFTMLAFQRLGGIIPPLTVTVRDKQLAQDYREGLRQFLGSVLVTLGRMAVMVLAALSHLTQAPFFLLVLIATSRHYGRRGESDDHMLPAPALQHQRRQGAVCLAA